ncbi:hypothetical protein CS542_01760 [Pedobacter sp. IW39]|nr:hypothetical protein CS542_01760 [Pedobacter sp. IW39]
MEMIFLMCEVAYYKESDKIIKTYTEGIGTTNLDSDDTTGSGLVLQNRIPKKVLKVVSTG